MKHATIIVTGSVICASLLSSIAFAQNNRDNDDRGRGQMPPPKGMMQGKRQGNAITNATAQQAACVATAVGVREDTIMAAQATQNTALVSATSTRKTEVMAAWNQADGATRKSARDAAVKKFQTAEMAARKALMTATQAAFKTFNASVKTCGLTNYNEQPDMMGGMGGGMPGGR